MKKILATLLALVFVLGIAGTALAAPANPFVDVPAKHWAYAAVTKLAKAGLVDGYGDGTFRGDRAMTRYEMAQVVAKAMAKSDKADAELKALIDKLAVEFAAELNNLGVRVAKLEKNASSIKFWGDSRIRYQDKMAVNSVGTVTGDADRFQQRFRLYMSSDVADNIKFEGRYWVQNTSNTDGAAANDNKIGLDYGKFTFKNAISGLDIQLGRDFNLQGYGLTSNPTGGFDGVKVFGGGNEVKFMVGVGDISGNGNAGATNGRGPIDTYDSTKPWLGHAYPTLNPMGNANTKEGLFEANVVWTPNKDFQLVGTTMRSTNDNYKYQIYTFGTKVGLGADFSLTGEWAHNSAKDVYDDNQRNAWFAQLAYKGATKSEVGSFGLFLNYKRYGSSSVDFKLQSIPIFEAISDAYTFDNGAKGWGVGFNYTVAKNAILTVTYEDLKALKRFCPYIVDKDHGTYLYAQLNLYF